MTTNPLLCILPSFGLWQLEPASYMPLTDRERAIFLYRNANVSWLRRLAVQGVSQSTMSKLFSREKKEN
jgi:hypothetical protein